MAYTLFEYPNVSDGEPTHPAGKRTAASVGQAYTLETTTQYVAVVSDADMYLRISTDGAVATNADHKLTAGETYGFAVRRGDAAKIYGIAAA